jgi:hypothetical protein
MTNLITLRSDQATLDNGTPFLPLGFYITEGTSAQRMEFLKTIAAAGFNTIHVSLGRNKVADLKFLNKAEALGVHVMAEFANDPVEVVKTYRNKPALLSWTLVDDANNGRQSAAQVETLNRRIQGLDHDHLTFIPVYEGFDGSVSKFFNSSDVVGWETYPIGNSPGNPYTSAEELGRTEIELSQAHEYSAPYNRSVWSLPQSFPWSNQRMPTASTARNQVYVSLINNVKGLVFYAFFYPADSTDPEWNLEEHPNLWKGIKALVPEIKTLTPIVLNGARTKVKTENRWISAAYWKYEGQTYIVAANLSEEARQSASIPLPKNTAGVATALFEGQHNSLTLQNNKLVGFIKPSDVQIYVIDTFKDSSSLRTLDNQSLSDFTRSSTSDSDRSSALTRRFDSSTRYEKSYSSDMIRSRSHSSISFKDSSNNLLKPSGKHDKLTSSFEHDILVGSDDADWLVFNTPNSFNTAISSADTVEGFFHRQGKIVLDKATFTALKQIPSKNLEKEQFEIVSHDQQAGMSQALIVYNYKNGKLFYNPNQEIPGFAAGGEFAVLSNHTALSSQDFLVL